MSIVSFGEKILYTPQVDYTKGSLYLLPPSYFTMNYLSSTWKNKLFLVVSPLPVGKNISKMQKVGVCGCCRNPTPMHEGPCRPNHCAEDTGSIPSYLSFVSEETAMISAVDSIHVKNEL